MVGSFSPANLELVLLQDPRNCRIDHDHQSLLELRQDERWGELQPVGQPASA
jgi:hypothetical protein